ncbi:hypothetical protein [Undibacterium sp.]|jgi:antitoxin component YwqK of YwqJK toxin-antitoxin module|uniref:toxin-antitoxin system YwqK family antitoxin n=1 Tax=Undibacterium sp. TaxID=1914977 RepID=UPI002BB5B923|nr:hypothetical protein [Undibacterium sp.]HTD03916.1 hypothetical protein [Undibacterium sp.]
MTAKSLLPLAGCCLLLHCGAALAIQDCEINRQPVNPNNGYTTEGKSCVMRCKDKDSGALLREQEIRNGKFIGLVRFYQDGKLTQEYSVNDKGNRDGVAREFAANGQMLREENYANGQQSGMAKNFHKNGKLRRATFYGLGNSEQAYAEFNEGGQLRELRCSDKAVLAPVVDDGALCGFARTPVTIEFFNDKAELRARATYDAGKRVRYETLWDNGKTSQLEENSNGRRIERSFSREGIKRRELVSRLGGKYPMKERQQEFSESGTLLDDRQWIDGELSVEKHFFLNGQLRSLSETLEDGKQRSVNIKNYYDSGILAGEEHYLKSGTGGYRQQAIGTHKSYNQRGMMVAASTYDGRGRLKHERSWDDAGRLIRDDEVFEDGSRKAYAK